MRRPKGSEGGYLYEIPLLVLVATLLGGLLWPWVDAPWRWLIGGVIGLSGLLLWWYHRSRAP